MSPGHTACRATPGWSRGRRCRQSAGHRHGRVQGFGGSSRGTRGTRVARSGQCSCPDACPRLPFWAAGGGCGRRGAGRTPHISRRPARAESNRFEGEIRCSNVSPAGLLWPGALVDRFPTQRAHDIELSGRHDDLPALAHLAAEDLRLGLLHGKRQRNVHRFRSLVWGEGVAGVDPGRPVPGHMLQRLAVVAAGHPPAAPTAPRPAHGSAIASSSSMLPRHGRHRLPAQWWAGRVVSTAMSTNR